MAATLSSQGTAPPSAPAATSPTALTLAEQEQVCALMTLTKHLSPAAVKEFRRQLREQDNIQSRLFKLPAELRNRIFEMAFLDDLTTTEASKTVVPKDLTVISARPTTETYKELQTLIHGPWAINACRQMRCECRSLLQLDKIEIATYATAFGETVPLPPPAMLNNVVPDGKFFWAKLHDSVQGAHDTAEVLRMVPWVLVMGVVTFPSTLGVRVRFFVVGEHSLDDLFSRSSVSLAGVDFNKYKVIRK